MNIKHKHIVLWLQRCKRNIQNFHSNYRSLSKDDKLKYIRYQYQLINIINNVIAGKTKITGFNFQEVTSKEKLKFDISTLNNRE